MSIFLCARCREYRDSDDGCEETGMYELICQDCVDERSDDGWAEWEPDGDAMANTLCNQED